MNETRIDTIEQVSQFLDGTTEIHFHIEGKDECYGWIERTLVKFGYRRLSRREKGLILQYLAKVSGYSRQQITRLVQQYLATGCIRRRQRTVNGFPVKYTREDILLLADMDRRHDGLSGPATRKLCERAFRIFGQREYERLAGISVSHLYNLRQNSMYLRQRRQFTKTRPVQCRIGERRRPNPEGRPGYIRIDTVHQGDRDGVKGVYHINAIDEVTQFEIIASTEKISERYLIPVLEALLEQFPFVIRGFHADNGSEYINRVVAGLLNKMLIALTKSRARQTNDNALVEGKNGSIVRKHLGYAHIPQQWAPQINRFNEASLNPYINYHRPCFFPVTVTDSNGKQRKTYPYEQMMTPYEKLKSLPHAEGFLKPGITFQKLDAIALLMTDNAAAEQMQEARKKLFRTILGQGKSAA